MTTYLLPLPATERAGGIATFTVVRDQPRLSETQERTSMSAHASTHPSPQPSPRRGEGVNASALFGCCPSEVF